MDVAHIRWKYDIDTGAVMKNRGEWKFELLPHFLKFLEQEGFAMNLKII